MNTLLRMLGLRLFLLIASLLTLSCVSSSAHMVLVDGESAMHHVREIVAFGPHPPGSDAQKQVGAYIADQLKSYGLEVQDQTFESITPVGRLEMTNIWGIAAGRTESVIILASHYDSKYFEDFPFVGANDSGSSSGLLLELARILARNNTTDYTLWFTFFDGEEALLEWTSADSLYGSSEFVKRLKLANQLHKVSALILLDMVGEQDLAFVQDVNSTDWLNNIIWQTASEMGYDDIFRPRGMISAADDHLPFAEEGIPVVDIIDMNYAYWHRREDTLDKLSAKNMGIVGTVVLASLPKIAARLSSSR